MSSSWLQDAPISRKLSLLVLIAVAVALSLSSGMLVLKHSQSEREALFRRLSAIADVLGANTTASLVFDDSSAARELMGSLQQLPSIEGACLYDAAGNAFAKFLASGAAEVFPPTLDALNSELQKSGLASVSKSIESDGEQIGTIYIAANLDAIYQELLSYAVVVALVFLIAMLVAYAITARLQRGISDPVLSLANTAERITEEGDYSIRVETKNHDEIGVLYNAFNRMLQQVEEGESKLQAAHNELEMRVEERTRQLSSANVELSNEVAERRRAEQELEEVHRDLVEAARSAGMAEVASSVLHNVGNVLNSVNVSASTISNLIRLPKRKQLSRLTELLESHRDDLGNFVEHDEKGQQIPKFLGLLASGLQEDDDQIIEESLSLTSNIEHIKAIIATQQSYAGTSGLVEPISINAILDDAVKLNTTSFERHLIRVDRNLADLPEVLVDKQRLLQIVINLIKNAKEALVEQQGQDRILTLTTQVVDQQLIIEVRDTGVGICPEDLSRVFTHGFSTKASGHGFGLHSCANAAVEMDGELQVRSDGVMKGATFTLFLPYKPIEAKV